MNCAATAERSLRKPLTGTRPTPEAAIGHRLSSGGWWTRLPHGDDGLILFALALMGALRLALIRHDLQADTWLALVDARRLFAAGLPTHDVAALMLRGRPMVDQQWLGQIFMYLLQRLGGLGLLATTFAGLFLASVGGGAVAARKLGASGRNVLVVLPVAWWLTFSLVASVRPEVLALPLFTALVYLLAADCRRPGRLVLLCLPILLVWANVHGSVVLGCALTSLRGMTLALELWHGREQRRRSAEGWSRALALIVGAPLLLVATPYGLHTLAYYRSTLFNHALSSNISEWQPLTRAPLLLAPLLLATALSAWLLVQRRRSISPWYPLSLALLAVAALLAQRNAIWFGLVLLVLVPGLLPRPAGAAGSDAGARALGRLTSAAAVGLVLAMSLLTLELPDAAFQTAFSVGALKAVQRSESASTRAVFADGYIADWLLWRDPQLDGKLAYDDHLELLTPRQFARLDRFRLGRGPGWASIAGPYGLIVLDSHLGPASLRGLSADSHVRVVYRGALAAVLTREVAGASSSDDG